MLDRFDISKHRFNPIWLLIGLIVGRAFGLIGGLNFGFWYFADASALIFWQVIGAIFIALVFSFVMTSDLPRQVKYAIVGFGIGTAIALYTGEIKNGGPSGLSAMDTGDGIWLEWQFVHLGFLGAIIGFITGALTDKKFKKPETKEPDEIPAEETVDSQQTAS